MATIDEWPLPPNPSNPTTQPARCLAPAFPNDPKIYYAKFNLGIIGELDPAGAFREFALPAALSPPPVPVSIPCLARGPKGEIWFDIDNWQSGMLGRFVPGTAGGTFTTWRMAHPASAPLTSVFGLRFDANGQLWFVGGCPDPSQNASNPAIVRFDMNSKALTWWPLPVNQMHVANTLHPEANGLRVWVSSNDPNGGATGGYIGVLDVKANSFTTYRPAPGSAEPYAIGLDLVDGEKPSVWFSAATATPAAPATSIAPKIYRFDAGQKVFQRYDLGANAQPRFVAAQADGSAWVSDIDRKELVFCGKRKACGTTEFTTRTAQIKPQSDTAVQQDARCEAAVTKTKPNRTTVEPNNTACTTLYPVGGAGTPDALAIAPPGPKNAFRLAYTSRASKSIFLVTP